MVCVCDGCWCAVFLVHYHQLDEWQQASQFRLCLVHCCYAMSVYTRMRSGYMQSAWRCQGIELIWHRYPECLSCLSIKTPSAGVIVVGNRILIFQRHQKNGRSLLHDTDASTNHMKCYWGQTFGYIFSHLCMQKIIISYEPSIHHMFLELNHHFWFSYLFWLVSENYSLVAVNWVSDKVCGWINFLNPCRIHVTSQTSLQRHQGFYQGEG